MNRNTKIYVAAGNSLFGSALKRRLRKRGFMGLIEAYEPDPLFPAALQEFFHEHRPEIVFLTSGRSGGIGLNQSCPATLMQDNLLTVCHLLDTARRFGVKRLLYLGSSCMYPQHAPQPLSETDLGAGLLEPSSRPYATARLAGMILCEAYRREYGCDFRVAIPANGYGPEDDFSPETGHVIPALIRRFHEAKVVNLPQVSVWGTGEPIRDFIHSDDVAEACITLMQQQSLPHPTNIGSGTGIRVKELVELLSDLVGYNGEISWDTTKANGQSHKVLDVQKIQSLGWSPEISLRRGLIETYAWYRKHLLKEELNDAQPVIS
jgi:GDP-L-fucose synthase